MENWQLALVVIAAILVGALIPLISQYRSTLKRVEHVVRVNESDFRRSMAEISELSVRLNRMGALVEGRSKSVEGFFDAFEGISDGVRRIGSSVRTASVLGAAVAPAVSAAIRAIQSSRGEEGEAPAGLEHEDGVGLESDHENDMAWVTTREGEEKRS